MKALISPNETFTVVWVSSWALENGEYSPVFSFISDCQRVAQVEQNEFEVAAPLFWVNCPDACTADSWYYKDGVISMRPQDTAKPE